MQGFIVRDVLLRNCKKNAHVQHSFNGDTFRIKIYK